MAGPPRHAARVLVRAGVTEVLIMRSDAEVGAGMCRRAVRAARPGGVTTMVKGREGRDVVAVLVALGIALLCSTVVRTVTAELTGTLGRVWPFSLVQEARHCTSACRGVWVVAGVPSR